MNTHPVSKYEPPLSILSLLSGNVLFCLTVFLSILHVPSEVFSQLGLKRFGPVIDKNGVQIDMYIEMPKTVCGNKSWALKLDVLSRPTVIQGGPFLSWKFKTVDCDDYVVENSISVDISKFNTGMYGNIDWNFNARSMEEGIYDVRLQAYPSSDRTRRLTRKATWLPMMRAVLSMDDYQSDSVKAFELSVRIESEKKAIEIELQKAGYDAAKDPFETTQDYQKRIVGLKTKRDALMAERVRTLERQLEALSNQFYRDRREPEASVLLAVERYDADASLWNMGFVYRGRQSDVLLPIHPDAARRLWTYREGISVHRVRDFKATREDVFEVCYGEGGAFSFLLARSDMKAMAGLTPLESGMFFFTAAKKSQYYLKTYTGLVDFQNTKQPATIMEFRYPAKEFRIALEKYIEKCGGKVVSARGFYSAKQIKLQKNDNSYYDIYYKVEGWGNAVNTTSIVYVIPADQGEDILLRNPNNNTIAYNKIAATSGFTEFLNGIHAAITDYEFGNSQITGIPEDPKGLACQKININTSAIQFDIGSSTLTPSSMAELSKLVDFLNIQCPNLRIRIEGHTENVGRPDLNQMLSEKRAAAVKTFLELRKVDSRRMTSIGFGQSRPVAENTTPEGRALNRRIEIIISQ